MASRAWGTLIWLLLFIVDLSFCFLRKKTLSEESVFRFRTHSLTNEKLTMNVNWRKEWKRFVMNNQSTFLKKKVGFVDDYIYEWIQ
jgi:hypothetical protein